MKSILVTGGAGFIGTNLIKKLVELRYDVICIDNYSTGLKSNEIKNCNYINGNILNIFDFNLNPDFVFHLAAIARIGPSFERAEDYINTNFQGTYEVVKFCSEKKIPLLYSGSSSKHNGKFENPYTFSKDLGEDIIRLYQKHWGLQASIARFYNVYGPHQLLDGPYTTLIGRWIRCIESGLQPVIYGDGSQRRDFTHVDDIISALILILEKKTFGYEFELGRGKNYSVNEIAEMFGIKPSYCAPIPGEAKNTLNNDRKAKEILNWSPQKNIENYIFDFLNNSNIRI